MVATQVQKALNSSAGASSLAVGSGQGWAAPTAGNVLIAWANSDITITLSGWTAGPSIVDFNAAYMWYKVAAGTETTITFSAGGSTSPITVGVLEYSGVGTPRDVQNSASVTQTNGTSTPSVSATGTSSTGDLWVCVAGLHAGTAPSSPSWTNGFVNQQSVNAGTSGSTTNVGTFVAEFQNTSAATVSTVASWTGSLQERQALLMAFPLSAGGGGGGTNVSLVGSTGVSSNTAGSFGPLTSPGTLQTGDLVIVEVVQNQTTAVTFTGTGWTTLSSTVNTTGAYAPLILYQIWGASSTMPTITSTTGKWAYCTMAFRSDSGTMAVENAVAGTGQTTAGTTLAAPASSTAKTSGTVSILGFAGRKSTTGATALTTTEPTNYIEGTSPSQSDASTNAGTTTALQQVATELCYDIGVTGTITPGNATFNSASYHTGYHIVGYGVPAAGVTNFAGWGIRINL